MLKNNLGRKEIIQAEYKKLMLEAAERVILRRGFRKATMDEIAREAQFSKATIYKYFSNKGAMVLEIIIQYFEEIRARLEEIRLSEVHPVEKLKLMIMSVLKIQAEKENISRMFIQDKNLWEFAHRLFASSRKDSDGDFQRALEIFKQKREDILRSGCLVVEEGIKKGVFVEDKPENIIKYISALIEGLAHIRYWQEERLSPEEETEQMIRFLMGGLARRPIQKGVE